MRKSGILMHISSLPSSCGIGKMGKSARIFADFLAASGINCWQVLPLSPTGFGDSPYQSFSIHAGNPFFIDFDILRQEGLLKKSDYAEIKWQNSARTVDYGKISANVYKVLKRAYKNFCTAASPEYERFEQENAYWLDDFALFMAIKGKNGGKPWYEWDAELALRNPEAVKKAQSEYAKDVALWKFMQFKFFSQWHGLKNYANEKGVEIIGDIPIYAAYDSVEVWTNPALFQIDENGKPIAVAGCPPDIFSPKGQLWGNPLYNWTYHEKNGFKWWIERIGFAQKLYDTIRIDHFRGFESYYAIPYGQETAENGEWKKAPGSKLFAALKKRLGEVNVIAEDLGFLTPAVTALLKETGFPGMKVLQFAFDSPENAYLPHNYETPHCVVYTGTHDNDTLKGWLSTAPKQTVDLCKAYTGAAKRRELPLRLLQMAWGSTAQTAIAPLQDFLELDSSARMNTPSTIGGNWLYRAKSEDFTGKLSAKIKMLNRMYNRGIPAAQAKKSADAGADNESIPQIHQAYEDKINLKGTMPNED